MEHQSTYTSLSGHSANKSSVGSCLHSPAYLNVILSSIGRTGFAQRSQMFVIPIEITIVFRGQNALWNHCDSFLGFVDPPDSASKNNAHNNELWSTVIFASGSCLALRTPPDGYHVSSAEHTRESYKAVIGQPARMLPKCHGTIHWYSLHRFAWPSCAIYCLGW